MGPIGHFAVGLAAKPTARKVPLGILLLATWILDILAIAFGFAGIEGVKRGIPWSHGLFMSVIWSVFSALLAARLYREPRRRDCWALGVQPLGAGLRFSSHPLFQLFLAFVAMELWTSPTTRPAASFRWLAESGTRLVQLHQRSRGHGIGVWNVHSGGRSLRNICFQEEKSWRITARMNRRSARRRLNDRSAADRF